jgi:hypothetical protein
MEILMTGMVNQIQVTAPRHIAPLDRRARRSLVARYACTGSTKEQAYRIRYQGYLSHGYIAPHPKEILSDQFDDETLAPSIVIYEEDDAVGTVRLCSFDSAKPGNLVDTLPSGELFGLTNENIRARFRITEPEIRAIEVSKLAKIPAYESDLLVTMALFKMLKILVTAMRTHVVFVAVRVPHMSLYRRLGFEVFEQPRHFIKDNVVLGLMACLPSDFRSIEDRAERIFREPDSLKANQSHDAAGKFFKGEDIEIFPPSFDEDMSEPCLSG